MNVRFWIILGALAAVLVLYPTLGSAVLGLLGTVAVAVAAQPVAWAFLAGVLARPHLARTHRSAR